MKILSGTKKGILGFTWLDFCLKQNYSPKSGPQTKTRKQKASPLRGAQGLCVQQSALWLHASQIFWAFFDLSPHLQGQRESQTLMSGFFIHQGLDEIKILHVFVLFESESYKRQGQKTVNGDFHLHIKSNLLASIP